MSPFLRVAIQAAEVAQVVIKKYYAQSLEVQLKEDQSPVTEADIETEKTIKSLIHGAFPDHGFLGEETGLTNPDAEYVWLTDPIDGTKSFIRQYPFFSTQIALMHHDELILGVSSAPLFNELAYAEKGNGAFLNDERIEVSMITDIKAATLSFGNIKTLAAGGQWQHLGEILQQVNRTRGYGDFYHYHLLAAGKIDVVVESDVNILDIAALSVIINEAGGVFTDLDGDALNLDTTSVLAAGSQELHDYMQLALQGD